MLALLRRSSSLFLIVRPGQHGEDLFGLISAMIHESAGRKSTVSVVLLCLALESLTTLVEAEASLVLSVHLGGIFFFSERLFCLCYFC